MLAPSPPPAYSRGMTHGEDEDDEGGVEGCGMEGDEGYEGGSERESREEDERSDKEGEKGAESEGGKNKGSGMDEKIEEAKREAEYHCQFSSHVLDKTDVSA